MTPRLQPRVWFLLVGLFPCHSFQTATPNLGAPNLPQRYAVSSCRALTPRMSTTAHGEDAVDMSQTWDPSSYQKNAAFVAQLGSPVLDLLNPRPGERILDLGCGDGVLTKQLAEHGCQVVGIDASAAQVDGARQLGLNAYVMDGANIHFDEKFDAVFSNAALHWMKDPDAVLAGVKRVLKPHGRFVAECGGYGNVKKIRTALEAAIAARGLDAAALNPWYFPSVEEYSCRLASAGFAIDTIELFDRPTPLPGDVVGWLRTFGDSYLSAVPAAEQAAVLEEVRERLEPEFVGEDGVWYADYVRLRFAARLTQPSE